MGEKADLSKCQTQAGFEVDAEGMFKWRLNSHSLSFLTSIAEKAKGEKLEHNDWVGAAADEDDEDDEDEDEDEGSD